MSQHLGIFVFVILDPFVFLGISAKVIPNKRTNESRSSLYVYNPGGYAIKEEEEEENGADEYRQAAQGGRIEKRI